MWQSANKHMKISSQNIAFCISLCYHIAKREALRLHRLSFRLYSLAALGASRSGFFYARNCNPYTPECNRDSHSHRLLSPNPSGPFEIQLSRSAYILLALLLYHFLVPRTSVLKLFYSAILSLSTMLLLHMFS